MAGTEPNSRSHDTPFRPEELMPWQDMTTTIVQLVEALELVVDRLHTLEEAILILQNTASFTHIGPKVLIPIEGKPNEFMINPAYVEWMKGQVNGTN